MNDMVDDVMSTMDEDGEELEDNVKITLMNLNIDFWIGAW